MFRIRRFFPVLLLLLLPSLGHATPPTPSLVDTWVTVSREAANWSGALISGNDLVATLIVEEQLGGVFRGTFSIESDKSVTKFEGKEGVGPSLSGTVLGVIDWDNVSVYWVDQDDETIFWARLVNENTMQVVILEAGAHAVAARVIMIRQ